MRKFSALVALSALAALHCTTDDDKPNQAPATGPIEIISPAKNAQVGVADTVTIIVRSDYSKFAGGIIITASFDSSKTWFPVRSKGSKDGIASDTVLWFPPEEAADPVVAGAKALLKVTDYSKEISTQREFFFRN